MVSLYVGGHLAFPTYYLLMIHCYSVGLIKGIRLVYNIYKRIPLFGLDFCVVQKYPKAYVLLGKKLKDNPISSTPLKMPTK